MPKHKEPDPEFADFEQRERMIDAFNGLEIAIDEIKKINCLDYRTFLVGIENALKDLGEGYTHEGYLKKIHRELHLLNKTLIMSALLISATKNPEETLNKYTTIIDEYLK